MPTWIYFAPIVVIVLIFVFMIPKIKKSKEEYTKVFEQIKDKNIILDVRAGNIISINGNPVEQLADHFSAYGLDDAGEIDLEFKLNFMSGDTQYVGKTPMHITFHGEDNKVYLIEPRDKKPKDDEEKLVDVSPVKSDELIFKSTFYIVTKDVTGTKDANALRGIF